jgi:hypothetical protein
MKYLEEERQNQIIENVNLIMSEFGGKKADNEPPLDLPDNKPNDNAPVEPDDNELSKEDEEFLLFLKNKYKKED